MPIGQTPGGEDPKPKSPDIKIPEYSFEEGVKIAVERILNLMESLKRDVYVIINGSWHEVGKSFLLSAIQSELTLRNVESIHVFRASKRPGIQVVWITIHEGIKQRKGENIRDIILTANPNAPGEIDTYADFYIGVYRPGKEFIVNEKSGPAADIIIRNEGAKDR
ncbi:hypothetical protein A3I95_01760 [Candidatus Nomurabacteria bacterium RIFCSPLOWO2_02_FULL_44_12]|uniref:Uncharacterized protein n=1 Tax=Candidatus Nomurabacteria bacterium RIFCSPLOWO2_12_FULL_44_11 TaxID=1801796 RepID=A0A1F6Y6F8_9BACT|nr:MAG: hypothetical protein A3E95_01330 [Candidatus Nomurabacteria bacterium RIFCSPHIGHO2_12_FULL_44_22b]OGJ01944.1 MAG: hypothetical protein A3G53_01505 [Candidatus Nomurabacteria bacterium RIFCSPLOWO2_12_FULL_44_11]OGJ08601.1 MAG: hypothetical protein A3I95_01760 [Candidatus Nomurabacteria bacterium RIFCSPLOWO2_02_FULL_44_12]